MAAFANQAGAARYLGNRHLGETVEAMKHGQATFLDELPGLAFAVVTLVWIVGSFAQLML
jgi:hypothetical protein